MERLSELAADLVSAKKAETEAKEWRLLVEQEILELLPSTKLEGTTTAATLGYKVSVTTKLIRSLDMEAYMCVKDSIPKGADFVDLKPAINIKQLRVAEKVAPEVVAACVTTKPGKTSIKIEEA